MIEYLKEMLQDIGQKTEGMSRNEKGSYILTYYWYHMLGAFAAVFLLLFLIVHFGFPEEAPEFTCVLINQEINSMRDQELAEAFSGQMGVNADTIVIDSDFNFSYGDIQLEGVNESSFEKFFFKWQNNELDAVVLPESFYEYCKEAGGAFMNLEGWNTGGLSLYQDRESGQNTAIRIEATWLNGSLRNETGEQLLLAFPTNGRNTEMCQKFVAFLMDEGQESLKTALRQE